MLGHLPDKLKTDFTGTMKLLRDPDFPKVLPACQSAIQPTIQSALRDDAMVDGLRDIVGLPEKEEGVEKWATDSADGSDEEAQDCP